MLFHSCHTEGQSRCIGLKYLNFPVLGSTGVAHPVNQWQQQCSLIVGSRQASQDISRGVLQNSAETVEFPESNWSRVTLRNMQHRTIR